MKPDLQSITVTIYRYADSDETVYAVHVSHVDSETSEALIDAVVECDSPRIATGSSLEEALENAGIHNRFFQEARWVG